jgi:hypothetical protein
MAQLRLWRLRCRLARFVWWKVLEGKVCFGCLSSLSIALDPSSPLQSTRAFDASAKSDEFRLRALSVLGFQAFNVSDDNVHELRTQLQALHQRVLLAKYATTPNVLAAVAIAASLLSENKVKPVLFFFFWGGSVKSHSTHSAQAFVPLTLASSSAAVQELSTNVPLSLHNALGELPWVWWWAVRCGVTLWRVEH